MIKLNICAARRPNMTHAEYVRYAIDNHARLVLGTEPVARHLRAYVQQHVYDAAYGAEAPAWRYDSVSHIYANSPGDLAAATATHEYKELVAPDEDRFADRRSPLFLMFEEQVLQVPTRGVSGFRLLHFLQCQPHTDAATLHMRCVRAHEEILKKAPELLGGVRRAVLNKALPGPDGNPAPYGAMVELGFLDHSDEASMRDYVERMQAATSDLVQPQACFYLLARTVPVFGTLD